MSGSKPRKKEVRMASFVDRGNRLLEEKHTDQAMKIVCEGLEYYTKRIIGSVFPYSTNDAALIIIALKHLSSEMEKDPVAKQIADGLEPLLKKPDLKQYVRIVKPNQGV